MRRVEGVIAAGGLRLTARFFDIRNKHPDSSGTTVRPVFDRWWWPAEMNENPARAISARLARKEA